MIDFVFMIDWRFIPTTIIYFPIMVLTFFIGIIKRNVFFVFSVNPKIFSGGLVDDSKYFLLEKIPHKYKPKTILINENYSDFEKVLQEVHNSNLEYPLVAKPDKGYAGLMVKKIQNEFELEKYHNNIDLDYIIQEFVDTSLELSIFICQFNNQFMITSLTEKKYFKLIPDGKLTVNQLITKDNEIKFRRKMLKKMLRDQLNSVLPRGAEYIPLPIGNWIYGASFFDLTDKIDDKIIHKIKSLNDSVEVLNYGRYDIKTESLKELKKGNFKVLEVNGLKAEPIHIYDKKHNLFFAYKEIFRHWKYVYLISFKEKTEVDFISVLNSVIKNYKMKLKYQYK